MSNEKRSRLLKAVGLSLILLGVVNAFTSPENFGRMLGKALIIICILKIKDYFTQRRSK